jgi:hypothetical protein
MLERDIIFEAHAREWTVQLPTAAPQVHQRNGFAFQIERDKVFDKIREPVLERRSQNALLHRELVVGDGQSRLHVKSLRRARCKRQ